MNENPPTNTTIDAIGKASDIVNYAALSVDGILNKIPNLDLDSSTDFESVIGILGILSIALNKANDLLARHYELKKHFTS